MRLTTRLGSLAALAASLSLVAGCAGGNSQIPASGSALLQHTASQPVQSMSVDRSLLTTHVSMVAPSAVHAAPIAKMTGSCSKVVKFISDYTNNAIYIYNGIGTTLCGTIAGLSNPQGMNVNGVGDLFVANTGASEILEFAPPYTGAPIKTISDPGYYPTDVTLCFKYMAITNIISTSGGAGDVEIYQGGKLRALHDSNALEEYFAACDKNDDLFTDGRNSSGGTIVNEFVGGKGPAKELTAIAGATSFPGGLRFVTKLYVDDQNNHTISAWSPPYTKEGKVVTLSGASDPVTFAVSPNQTQFMTADAGLDEGVVYSLSGTVQHTLAPGQSGGTLIGAQWSKNP